MTIKERIQNYLGYSGLLLSIIKIQGELDRKIEELEEKLEVNITYTRDLLKESVFEATRLRDIHDNLRNDHNELYKIFRIYLHDNGFEIADVEIDDPKYKTPKMLVKRIIKRKK